MGNKKVQAHGLHFFLVPAQLPKRVFDSYLLFDEASEFDRAKVDVPYPVVNLFKSDILTGAGDTDIHLIAVPADATERAKLISYHSAIAVRAPVDVERSASSKVIADTSYS